MPPKKKTAAYTEAVVVHIGRSDGVVWTTQQIDAYTKGDTIISEPLPGGLTAAANEMQEAQITKFMTTLGRDLADQLHWPKDKQYLVVFPENYYLRIVATSSMKEGHVFGHPGGCDYGSRFRSPHSFVLHLLWLLSDSTNHMDCQCDPCRKATNRPKPKKTLSTTVQSSSASGTKSKSKSTDSSNTGPSAYSAAANSSKRSTAPDTASNPEPKRQRTNVTTAAVQSVASPSPTPHVSQPVRVVGLAPANAEPTMFRRGEMVWYQQETAWRIGIIGTERQPHYILVPLGHRQLPLPNVTKAREQMRPFLTFSVPAITVSALHGKTFNEVDWDALANAQNSRPEAIGLEASKKAAEEIDSSWSPFNPIDQGQGGQAGAEYYEGVFLGAEMIRLGDPIRPRDKSRAIVLEVKRITVEGSNLSFQGDEWTPTLMSIKSPTPNGVQPEGSVFVSDREFRSKVASKLGQKCIWSKIKENVLWREQDVGGRTYVTNELMSVTDPDRLKVALESGQFQEASAYLNNRMQNSGVRNIGKKLTRNATVGLAVNVPLALGEGIKEYDHGV